MLIHTMTPAELVLDARKDIQAMRNTCTEPLRKLRRELAASEDDTLLHLFDWESPNKNNWLVLIKHSNKRTLILSLAWFTDREGKLAALWTTGSGTSFLIGSDVFERSGEHFDPDESPIERLQSFFLENHLFSFEPTGQKSEHLFEVSIGADQGMGLGEWDRTTDIVHWHTFVHHGQLFENQENAMDMGLGERQQLINLAQKTGLDVAAFMKQRKGRAA